MADLPPPSPVIAQEIRIVDAQGRPRIVLSAGDGSPSIRLLGPDGAPRAEVTLDAAFYPAVKLSAPDPAAPAAALEVDAKGAHVKFDRPGGGSSYLFLNDGGSSGVVLIDRAGKRRLDALVAADGSPSVNRYDAAGAKLP